MTASSKPLRALAAAAILWLGWALEAPRVRAQQPTVKDLLGKAQTQSETKAVEDLIGKLERRQGTPQKSAPAPAANTTPTPTSPEQPAIEPATPKENAPGPPPDSTLASPKSPDPPTDAAPIAAPRPYAAEQMPSVELEVLFEYKSARLTPAAVTTLTPLGRALIDPRLVDDFFLIAGHTDAKGSADSNVRLSQQRADAVRDFLVKQFKIDPKRLIARGFGDRRLKDPDNPFDDKNRRVQVINFTPPKAQ